jgi:epoxyqueuosine reductase
LNKSISELTQFIKQKSILLGFTSCGISQIRELSEQSKNIESWLANNFHGEMTYMERNKEMRLNPALLVEGAKSIISFTFNYFPQELQPSNTFQIAKYAYGDDYHKVLKDKLHTILSELKALDSSIEGRVFTDSAPILERAWAVESGLGWIGKNSLLILPQKGSFFFLAEIILNKELEYDIPFTYNYCGTCTKCITACPTKAIIKNGVVDARKCISYLTIEKKGNVSASDIANTPYIFGCDICQDVCPWNRFSETQSNISLNQSLINLQKKDYSSMTEVEFEKITKNSPLKRAGYMKLKNIIKLMFLLFILFNRKF